ncbi:MAG: hypothetical protein LBO82_05455 [Synergistaceae bacterium]|jgi:hypothetical protein|nr:hypothetical protein [Synergistaceae bacterium]
MSEIIKTAVIYSCIAFSIVFIVLGGLTIATPYAAAGRGFADGVALPEETRKDLWHVLCGMESKKTEHPRTECGVFPYQEEEVTIG